MKKQMLFLFTIIFLKSGFALYASSDGVFKKQCYASVGHNATSGYISELNAKRFVAANIQYGSATFENRRGYDGRPAYANQDRSFVGTLLGAFCFMICDGHGSKGDVVASKVIEELPKKLLGTKDKENGFFIGCLSLQKFFATVAYAKNSGTTMVGAVIKGKTLTVGHVGDSRLIVIRGGVVVFATADHSVKNYTERKRVIKAGGRIFRGYVYGSARSEHCLAVTRSLGDIDAHDGDAVIARPAVSEFELQEGDYIVLASDGYWDVVSNDETVRSMKWLFGKNRLTKPYSCDDLARKFVDFASKAGSRDDITVVVVYYGGQ